MAWMRKKRSALVAWSRSAESKAFHKWRDYLANLKTFKHTLQLLMKKSEEEKMRDLIGDWITYVEHKKQKRQIENQ